MLDLLHHSTRFGRAQVTLFGRQPRLIEDEGRLASTQAVQLGASPSKICRMIVASDKDSRGFQSVRNPDYLDFIYSDGVLLTEKSSAAVLQTGDCPVVILRHKRNGNIVVSHAGRPALTPYCKEESSSCDFTVLETALSYLKPDGDMEEVEALVIGNICGRCFKHDKPEAKEKVAWFYPLGDHVFTDISLGALDLFAVIKHRLTHLGVPKDQVYHAGECTFENHYLASHRRGDKDIRNTVIVVLKE